jgi:hypothetical protein
MLRKKRMGNTRSMPKTELSSPLPMRLFQTGLSSITKFVVVKVRFIYAKPKYSLPAVIAFIICERNVS